MQYEYHTFLGVREAGSPESDNCVYHWIRSTQKHENARLKLTCLAFATPFKKS